MRPPPRPALCPGPGWELAYDPDDLYPTRHLRIGPPVMTPKWRRVNAGPTHPSPEPPAPYRDPGDWCPFCSSWHAVGTYCAGR